MLFHVVYGLFCKGRLLFHVIFGCFRCFLVPAFPSTSKSGLSRTHLDQLPKVEPASGLSIFPAPGRAVLPRRPNIIFAPRPDSKVGLAWISLDSGPDSPAPGAGRWNRLPACQLPLPMRPLRPVGPIRPGSAAFAARFPLWSRQSAATAELPRRSATKAGSAFPLSPFAPMSKTKRTASGRPSMLPGRRRPPQAVHNLLSCSSPVK
jgi:hypothetical protein